jgi:L-alanine-DL-glutamate epimerase-like enolase superfamily enzyme
MKITDVKTILLTGPFSNDPYMMEMTHLRSSAFIEIQTDKGVTGFGETYAGYFFPEGVPPIVEFFKPILIGQDVSDIPKLWQRMYHCGNFWCRVGLGLIVLNGIEAALWDLKGKLLDKPVCELLGGCKHDKLLCYASGGPSNYPKTKLAEKIDNYMSLGYRAFKIGAGSWTDQGEYIPSEPQEAADFEGDKISFLRSHVGDDIELMMDGHMGNSFSFTWNLPIAKAAVKAVEPYNLLFFEEPLHYTDPWGYSELCKSTTVDIAGGECLTGTYEWRVFTEVDAFDVGQPDAAFTGGLMEFMKVARMMEDRDRKIATHCNTAGGGFMQNLHCGFACSNTIILEVLPAYGPMHTDIFGDSFVMKDGYALSPKIPGLGIDMTDEIKQKYPFIPGTGEFSPVEGKVLVNSPYYSKEDSSS